MACQMPVGTGLKMGWDRSTGDRGILPRCTIRVINRHKEGTTSGSAGQAQSRLPTMGDMKHNLCGGLPACWLANVSVGFA